MRKLVVCYFLTSVACIETDAMARFQGAARLVCSLDGTPVVELYIEAEPSDTADVWWFDKGAGTVSCEVQQ